MSLLMQPMKRVFFAAFERDDFPFLGRQKIRFVPVVDSWMERRKSRDSQWSIAVI